MATYLLESHLHMSSLANKRIVLGVTGSIAAYKSADLVRRLRDAGAVVRVVMTAGGREFITPLTLQALSGQPVHSDLLDVEAEAAMGHIQLAKWADLVLIAPASADCLARLVQGRGNDLLGAICLATRAPLAVAPAMNQAMWADVATQANVDALKQRGVHLFGPGEGEQACGDVGAGRMLEPAELVNASMSLFATGSLAGLQVLITAGPTREPIDPMRYISNRSSGRMGYAVAEACVEAGATVTLISGPVCLAAPERLSRIDIETADEMLAAVEDHLEGCDIFISAAAVADYRPAQMAEQKLKKSDEVIHLELTRNEDVLARVAARDVAPFTVGFAAETENIAANAQGKLQAKGLDMIAANKIGRTEAGEPLGVESEDNALRVFWQGGEQDLAKAHKSQLARQLVALIGQRYHEK